MDLGLRGRRAAVAAATSGLGLESARALLAEGARVVICGRDRDRLDAALAQLDEGPAHGAVHGVVADVSGAQGGADFVAAASEVLGGIDVLVTNAGGPPPGNFASVDPADYAAAIELNLMSVVGMCTAAVPAMRSSGWGRIVAITSVAVRQPAPDLILSNTARAGATAMLKTLAREVAADGVTVNSLQPGLHRTPRLVELYGGEPGSARLGDPADFGSVVAFLCSEQARFINGAHLQVDGGAYAGLL